VTASKLVVRSLFGEPSILSVDGKSLEKNISGFSLDMGNGSRNLTLFAIPGEVDLEVDIEAIHVVRPPEVHDALRTAIAFMCELDPKEIEAMALEGLQWGGPQNMSHATFATILKVLANAADELEADPEVSGSSDEGSDPGGEDPEQPNGDLGRRQRPTHLRVADDDL
jgi:hypothetical protein